METDAQEGITLPKDDSDFRMYLEVKFNLVHEIVGNLEKQISGVDLSVKELSHIVETIKVIDSQHFILCPNTESVKILGAQVAEFNFFKKYRRSFLLAGAATIFGFFIAAYEGFVQFEGIYHKYQKGILEIEKIEATIPPQTQLSFPKK